MEKAYAGVSLNMLIPILGALIAFISALVIWFLNERSKRSHEEYLRKEERYASLIRNLRGFYESSANKELKTEFLEQLNLSWMYCPDDVIKKTYAFLQTVHTATKCSDAEKERALGELILAIRNDLAKRKRLKRSDLKPGDFKHLRST